MANAVLIQNPRSIYDDRPGVAYHFPKRYLRMIQECIGDWVIFYEGKGGALGYTSIQKLRDVTPDDNKPDHYYAWLEEGTAWSFETIVGRNDPSGVAYETSLGGQDGRAISGGVNVSAVRRLTGEEFVAIVTAGLQPMEGPNTLPRTGDEDQMGFLDPQADFEHAPLQEFRSEMLVSRAARDSSFARQVKAAYDGKCAISGLYLRNGGGRPEVQAAHIRSVSHEGPDIVSNGLALSGTLHWMFDRGLISVGEGYEILVSHNKVPAEARDRLIAPGRTLIRPANPRHHPHPDYLRYHRETIFGMTA